jgi:hypothetical protein
MAYRGYRPSYKTSEIRYCASVRIGLSIDGLGGRTIQTNHRSPRELVQVLRGMATFEKRLIVLKVYTKGGQ